MTNKFDAVLFDFDGTIADTGVGIFNSVRFAVAALGFKPLSEKQLRSFIGPPIFDSFKRELGMSDEQCELAVRKYRELYSRSGIYQFELYPGIEPLIRELKENGMKVCIASSKPEKFIIKIVSFLKMDGIIDLVSAPKDDSAPQDKSYLINNVSELLGVEKSRMLMVGDRHFDINGARVAGVESVGVTYGYGSEDELKKAGADHIARSAAEIREVIFS